MKACTVLSIYVISLYTAGPKLIRAWSLERAFSNQCVESQPGILSGVPEIVEVGTVNLGYLTKVLPKFHRLRQINQHRRVVEIEAIICI